MRKPPLTVMYPRSSLAAYLPHRPSGSAMIICRGAGYSWQSYEEVGARIAGALNQWGVTAFLLKQQLPNDAANRLMPLLEAQRAIKLVRDTALEWKLNPNKIGVLGFSAGNHPPATVMAELTNAGIPNLNLTNLRPDLVALVTSEVSAGRPSQQHELQSFNGRQPPEVWMQPLRSWLEDHEWVK